MNNTTLVPLDGSRRAEKILGHVEQLSHCSGYRVIFLQIVNLPNVISYDDTEIPLFRQDINAKSYVVNGPIVKEIINCAERESVDLIAMTSHPWQNRFVSSFLRECSCWYTAFG
jgi:hypothetical protein